MGSSINIVNNFKVEKVIFSCGKYNEIKKQLINNEINRIVKKYSINKSDLITYYNVGKMLSVEINIMV